MKIIHLVQKPQLRGAEVFASQLAAQSIRSGHQVILVFLFQGTIEFPFDHKMINLNGTPSKKLRDIKAWKKLARIIREEKPDIIQANAGDTLKYAVFSKLLYRWKQPIVFRNASTISLYIKTSWARRFNNFFFRFTSKIISVSKECAADFISLYPQYQKKVITIPIGIEHAALGEVTADFPMSLLNRDEGPVLVHVGGFTYEKNHTGLISIFQKVLKKQNNAQLHLVGNGPLKEQVEELVKEKGLQNKVIFHGHQKEAMQYIKRADVLVLPSIIEGLPGVILEAFYCKTPVVAYDVGGIKEIVLHNQTGRLIPKGDEDAFASGVLEAVVKNSQNKQMVEEAYKLVVSKYLNTKITDEFLKTYAAVVY